MFKKSKPKALEIPGGEIIGTGGNCEAICVELPNSNRYVLVTSAGDGGHTPDAGDPVVDVGIYMRDVWEPLEMHEGMLTKDLLARLPVWTAEPPSKITLEQFRRTRREVPDLGVEISGGDLAGQRGFLYAGDVYMTISEGPMMRYVTLTLTGWDLARGEDELSDLEDQLYNWAVSTGALDNVTATDTKED